MKIEPSNLLVFKYKHITLIEYDRILVINEPWFNIYGRDCKIIAFISNVNVKLRAN